MLTLTKVDSVAELDPTIRSLEATGAIYVRVSRFPYGFAEACPAKADTDSASALRNPQDAARHVFCACGPRDRDGRRVSQVDERSGQGPGTGLCSSPTPITGASRSGSTRTRRNLRDHQRQADRASNRRSLATFCGRRYRRCPRSRNRLPAQDAQGREGEHVRREAKKSDHGDCRRKCSRAGRQDRWSASRDVTDRAKAKVRAEASISEAKRRAKVDQTSIDAGRQGHRGGGRASTLRHRLL